MNKERKRLFASTPLDLINRIRAVEGWPRIEGDSLATIRRAKTLYRIDTDGIRYVATPLLKEKGRA